MKNIKYIILSIGLFSFQSCFVAKEYSRPEKEVVTELLFRTDNIPQDSLSIANLSWKDVFTDDVLSKHINTALTNNLDIRIALQSIQVAEAYLKQGKAAYFPTLNGGASYTYANPSLNSSQGIGLESRQELNQYELSANLSWEADVWGKIRSNQRAASATYLQSISAHQVVKSNLVALIASNYYQLLALDAQREITLKNIQIREESLETMRALKEAGNVTEVAVKQTEAQLLNTKATLLDIENSIKLLENTFCILLGENPHTVERTKLNEQEIKIELSTGLPIELLSNRPDVMAAEYGLINAFELTNLARSSFYPSLRLTASGGIQSMNFNDLFSANSLFANLIGSLTQPILNGRQIRTQYEVSKAQQESALLNYKKIILTASKEVSDALFSYQTNADKKRLKEQEYEAYQLATEYSEELLRYGMANYLEVLTAQQSALNAELSVINTELSKLNALIQLYKAVGGGWR